MRSKNHKKAALIQFIKTEIFSPASVVKWYDWLILLVLMGFCFFAYAMSDLFHTTACSYGYLDGHILDFYDYLAENGINSNGTIGINASYMPSIYILFAIWNIPMKLFGFVSSATMQLGIIPIMWAKLLPCIVFLASAKIVFLIAKELGMSGRKPLIVVYAYLSCPVLLYGQFIIGQYESFFTALVLLGFYFWLKEREIPFLLSFAFAFTFKYTALFVFLPLLLLREKRIWKILVNCLFTTIPYVIEYLIYMHSDAFTGYVFGIGHRGDNPTGYIENAALFTGFTFGGNLKFVIYILVVAFALILGWAYFLNIKEKTEEKKYAVFFIVLALSAFFCLSKWHTHWLMPLFAFTTIAAFMHKRLAAYLALDLIFGMLFIMFCTCQFEGAHDEAMINNGVFKFLLPDHRVPYAYSLTDYYRQIDMSMQLTFMTAIMAAKAVFCHPKFLPESTDQAVNKEVWWMRARLIMPMLFLIIPSILIIGKSVNVKAPVYNEDIRAIYVNMEDQKQVSQPFISEGSGIVSLVFPISRGKVYDDAPAMKVSVSDRQGQVLYESEVDIEKRFEGQLLRLYPGELGLETGDIYYVNYEILNAAENSTFCLLAYDQGDFQNALSNGQELPYHMDMRIYQ